MHIITGFGLCGDTALASPVQGSIRSNQPRCGYFCSFLPTGVHMLSSTQVLGIWGVQSTVLRALHCPVLGQYWGLYLTQGWASTGPLPWPVLGHYWTSTGPVLGHYWTSTGPVLDQYWNSTEGSTLPTPWPLLGGLCPPPVLGHY